MNLFTSLMIRLVLIIAITDAVVFYVVVHRNLAITVPFVISVILVTIVPIAINIWYVVYKSGII